MNIGQQTGNKTINRRIQANLIEDNTNSIHLVHFMI